MISLPAPTDDCYPTAVLHISYLSLMDDTHARPPDLQKKKKTTYVSLNGLGYLYLHGLGVERDVRAAFEYFEQARREDKDMQNPDILFNLGMVSRTVMGLFFGYGGSWGRYFVMV